VNDEEGFGDARDSTEKYSHQQQGKANLTIKGRDSYASRLQLVNSVVIIVSFRLSQ